MIKSEQVEARADRSHMQSRIIKALATEYALGKIDMQSYRQERKHLIDQFTGLQALEATPESAGFLNSKLKKMNPRAKKSIVFILSIAALFLLAYIQSPYW